MKNEIKTFKLFVRPDERSKRIADKVREENSKQKNPLTESDDADLIIVIGGDGSFIHGVTNTNFSKEAIYTGIHTGTLGFMQDLCEEDIPELFRYICSEPEIKTRKVCVAAVTINLKDGSNQNYFVLNDIVIAGKNYGKISFTEYINGNLLQNITACGINIATNNGDTAFSKSLGGTIDFSNNIQLVCELIAPIGSIVTERFLPNTITCKQITIVLKSADNVIIKIDGIEKDIDSKQIQSIEVSMMDDSNFINKLNIKNYSKITLCRQKLLGYKE